MESAQPPALREIKADSEISTALNGIAMQMAGLRHEGLAPEQCRDLYARLLVEMVNAAGIDMYGRTLFNPAANAPQAVNAIAEQLGTAPNNYRTKLFVSPYERFAVGSGALIVQQDMEGQDHVLLVRTAKHPDQWTLPGGYMDPLPASQFTLPDRVSPEMRSQQEEAQVAGKRLDLPVATGAQGATLPITALPSTKETTKTFVSEYRRLLKEQGWKVAYTAMNDGDYLRAAMAGADVAVPANPANGKPFDLTPEDNIRREAKEETGLDIAALEHAGRARITQTGIEVGLAAGGGKRPNFVTPHFLIDLGRADALPCPKPEDKEIIEAKWMKLDTIRQDPASGNYMVWQQNAVRPIDVFVIPHMEQSLNTLLSQRMQEASGGRVESVDGLLAQGASWQGREAFGEQTLAGLYVQKLSAIPAEHRQFSLVGEAGQLAMRSFVEMAAVLGQAQDSPVVVQAPRPQNGWVDKIAQAVIDSANTIHR